MLKKYINSAHSLNNRGIQKCVQRQIFQKTIFLKQYTSKINVLNGNESCFSLSQPYISHGKIVLQIIEPISLTVRHFVSVTFKCTWRSMFGSCYAYKLAMPIQWL